jgi:hypothetical protein
MLNVGVPYEYDRVALHTLATTIEDLISCVQGFPLNSNSIVLDHIGVLIHT